MSDPTKRIDTAVVPEMFHTAGIEPVRWKFYSDGVNRYHPCGCILTAVVLSYPGDYSVTPVVIREVLSYASHTSDVVLWIARRTGFHRDYLDGLLAGWDGIDDDLPASTLYTQGFADGATAWKACARDFNLTGE